ncbi:MAG: hypothetical protein IT379_00075 [Deltaproteobacteria bacterium]|nr:hypothetical protein [Deltaproteobacteria bacterium]
MTRIPSLTWPWGVAVVVAVLGSSSGCCSAAASVRAEEPSLGAPPVTSNDQPGLPPPGSQPSAPPVAQAPASSCEAAFACCTAYVDAMAPGMPEARNACDQIRTLISQPSAPEACGQMVVAWRQALTAMGRPIPPACR